MCIRHLEYYRFDLPLKLVCPQIVMVANLQIFLGSLPDQKIQFYKKRMFTNHSAKHLKRPQQEKQELNKIEGNKPFQTCRRYTL